MQQKGTKIKQLENTVSCMICKYTSKIVSMSQNMLRKINFRKVFIVKC